MATSVFPVTVSGNVVPGSGGLAEQYDLPPSQAIELATWHLHQGDPINFLLLARAKRPVRGLKYRLNIRISDPAILAKRNCCAVLFADRSELAAAAKTGVLDCLLASFCESPEIMLATMRKLAKDLPRNGAFLATFDFPCISLEFALSSNVEISTKVTPRFEQEATEMQKDWVYDEDFEAAHRDEGDDFADSDVVTIAADLQTELAEPVKIIDRDSLETICEALAPRLGITPAALEKLLEDIVERPEHYEIAAGGTDRDEALALAGQKVGT